MNELHRPRAERIEGDVGASGSGRLRAVLTVMSMSVVLVVGANVAFAGCGGSGVPRRCSR